MILCMYMDIYIYTYIRTYNIQRLAPLVFFQWMASSGVSSMIAIHCRDPRAACPEPNRIIVPSFHMKNGLS